MKQFIPTPEEIRTGCLAIQAGWDAREEYEHRAQKNPEAIIPGTDRVPLWEDVGQTRDKLRLAVPAGKTWGQKNVDWYAGRQCGEDAGAGQ